MAKSGKKVAVQTLEKPDAAVALVEGGEVLAAAISAAMPDAECRVCAQVQQALTMQSDGRFWKDVERETGLTWRDVTALRAHYPAFRPLWDVSVHAGSESRLRVRDEAAHVRAVEGTPERTTIRRGGDVEERETLKPSDRLLEMMRREDHPDVYPVASGAPAGGTGGGISYTFIMSPPPAPAPALPPESGSQLAPKKPIIEIQAQIRD